MTLKLVSAPAERPITVDEAKAHLRVDHTDDDELIEGLIEAATDYVQRFLGRSLVDQVWDYYLDAFPTTGPVEIPMPPLIEVLGVFYRDSGDVEQAFTDFEFDDASGPGRLYLLPSYSWPTPGLRSNAVRIRFRAGYVDASDSPSVANIPPSIIVAIKMFVGTLYENRETIGANTAIVLPWSAEQLLRMYRVEKAMA